MEKDVREYLDAHFEGVRAKIQANCDITDMMYKQIEKQNGRITSIEKETSFWRLVYRNPGRSFIIILLVLFGVVFAMERGWFGFLNF